MIIENMIIINMIKSQKEMLTHKLSTVIPKSAAKIQLFSDYTKCVTQNVQSTIPGVQFLPRTQKTGPASLRSLFKAYDAKYTNIGLPLEFQILETVNCQLKNVAAGFPLGDHLCRAFGAEAFLFADAVGIVAGEDFRQQGQQILPDMFNYQ